MRLSSAVEEGRSFQVRGIALERSKVDAFELEGDLATGAKIVSRSLGRTITSNRRKCGS